MDCEARVVFGEDGLPVVRRLKKLHIDRVDLVERGANPGAVIAFAKAEDPITPENGSSQKKDKQMKKAAKIAKAEAARPYPSLPQGSAAPRTANLTTSSAPTIPDAPRNPAGPHPVEALARQIQQVTGAAGGYMSNAQAIAAALARSTPAEKAAYRQFRLEADWTQGDSVAIDKSLTTPSEAYAAKAGESGTAGRYAADPTIDRLALQLQQDLGIGAGRARVEAARLVLKHRTDEFRSQVPVAKSVSTQSAAVGAAIRKLRKAQGLSQTELAVTVGVSPRTVAYWEAGESLPENLTTTRLAKALGMDLDTARSLVRAARAARPVEQG